MYTTESSTQREIIDPDSLIRAAESELATVFSHVDEIAFLNQRKVLAAFREHRLTEEYFAERTGYGLDDPGRAAIDRVFAEIFGAEKAAVRMQLVSGTHAIACALLGNLRPGQRLASLTGEPYDTLLEVIGVREPCQPGSLKKLGVSYVQEWLDPTELSDSQLAGRVTALVSPPTMVAYIQKSCGYSFTRRTLSNQEISQLVQAVKRANPSCIVFVDNCYGEFVETQEPPMVGADLSAGSLIKNPGGGLAISGGYIVGRENYVNAALNRLTAPGVGGHQGLTYNQNRLLLQGIFLAPSVVSHAVKAAHLFAYTLSKLGLHVKPGPFQPRYDIIQAVEFGSAERLISFCQALQRTSPINAHVVPEPVNMPGYEDKIVMAGGTFVEGSTIELSADGPLRPPYAGFVQGGLTYAHVRCALAEVLAALL